MQLDQYGTSVFTPEEIFKYLYSGGSNLNDIIVSDEDTVKQFNNAVLQNADSLPKLKIYQNPKIDLSTFDLKNQKEWFMPKDAVQENLMESLWGMCKTDQQRARVEEELELFSQHGMIDLLFYLKYLVDTMRNNNIIWGVGRGSSVASYVLYLMGIHKIDSIKYNLDIKEFLK